MPAHHLGWLAHQDTTAEAIVGVERIRRENPEAHVAIMEAASDDTTRKVLTCLLKRPSATYADLVGWCGGVARRTVERRIRRLKAADVVRVSDAQPALLSLTNERVEVLTSDVLYYIDMAINK